MTSVSPQSLNVASCRWCMGRFEAHGSPAALKSTVVRFASMTGCHSDLSIARLRRAPAPGPHLMPLATGGFRASHLFNLGHHYRAKVGPHRYNLAHVVVQTIVMQEKERLPRSGSRRSKLKKIQRTVGATDG